MTETNELRGLIYARYKSKSDLADALGWSKQRLYKALAHPEKQSMENIHKIVEALGLEIDQTSLSFFMPKRTT